MSVSKKYFDSGIDMVRRCLFRTAIVHNCWDGLDSMWFYTRIRKYNTAGVQSKSPWLGRRETGTTIAATLIRLLRRLPHESGAMATVR